jgi:hypothetical protein
VRLRAVSAVGLEGALGHEKLLLLIRRLVLGQTMSINEPEQSGQTSRGSVLISSPGFLRDLSRRFASFAVKSL